MDKISLKLHVFSKVCSSFPKFKVFRTKFKFFHLILNNNHLNSILVHFYAVSTLIWYDNEIFYLGFSNFHTRKISDENSVGFESIQGLGTAVILLILNLWKSFYCRFPWLPSCENKKEEELVKITFYYIILKLKSVINIRKKHRNRKWLIWLYPESNENSKMFSKARKYENNRNLSQQKKNLKIKILAKMLFNSK